MRETPEQFVNWLMAQYDDPEARRQLSHTEIYGRLQKIEVGQSLLTAAITTHEMYTSYRESGFTEAQAMRLVLNTQAAAISAAAAQQYHKEENDGGNAG